MVARMSGDAGSLWAWNKLVISVLCSFVLYGFFCLGAFFLSRLLSVLYSILLQPISL